MMIKLKYSNSFNLWLALLYKKRVRNTAIYFIFSILQKGLAFILIPIYTKYLSPDQYGIIATVSIFSIIITLIYFVCIHESAYFGTLKNEVGIHIKISTILYFEIFLILIGIITALVLNSYIHDFLIFGIKFYPYIFYTILTSLFNSIVNIFLLIQKAKEKIALFSIFSFSVFLISTAIILLLMIKYQYEAMSYIYAQLIVNFIAFWIVLFWLFNDYGWHFSSKTLKESIKFSSPLILHNSAHYVRSGLDKIFLSTYAGLSSTGVYNITTSIGSIFTFAFDAFISTNNPRFFSLIKDKKNEPKIVPMLTLSTGLFSLVALFISIFGKEIVALFVNNIDYLSAYLYIPTILSSMGFFLIYLNLVNVLFYKANTKLIASITISTSVVTVIIGFILIQFLSIWGAALWVFLSNILMAIFIFIFSQKTYYLNWNILRASLFSLLPMISSIMHYFSLSSMIIRLSIFTLMCIAILLLIKNDFKAIINN